VKDIQDAYGYELYDYYANQDGMEIIERDDGFISTTTNISVYFAPYEQWPNRQKEAMKYVHGRVLDIGCGAGRHTLYLQEGGLEVTAVDTIFSCE